MRRLARTLGYLLGRSRSDPDIAAGRVAKIGSSPGIDICWSGSSRKPPLLLSPGFGAQLHDYGALRQLFAERYCFYRLRHSGTDRTAAARLGVYHLLQLGILGWSRQFSARKLRRQIHSCVNREVRSLQFEQAIGFVLEHSGCPSLSLVGHSFGTDTVLNYAVTKHGNKHLNALYLFSPHPVDYLIPQQQLQQKLAEKVLVITGDQDRTPDGVEPEERLGVLEPLGQKNLVQGVFLQGFGHLDPAMSFQRQAWLAQLERELFSRT